MTLPLLTAPPMKRLVVLSLLLAACDTNRSAEHYGFIARLGVDTVSVENVTRNGSSLVSDEVDRFPRVRQRHTEIVLGADGGIRHLAMDVITPSEPADQRERHVVADVTGDSVHISKRDKAGAMTIAFATGGGITMAHLPQMYSLIDLYFEAALHRADATKLAAGDSVRLRQFYIDREFDRFPLHSGYVHPLPGGKAELRHDWLSGTAEATFDSAHRMLTYSGARSTYKVEVRRITEPADVASIGARFAALETSSGGAKQLSVRDTTRANIGSAVFMVDYGRPLARGRVLLGDILTYDRVWRTGANAATQFSTSEPITLAGIRVPKGTYTLWTVPREKGADLIVNKQIGQWGTGYNGSLDLGMASMATETIATTVERFTISITARDAHHGTLVLEWGSFRWTAPIVVL
ncbi:MAG: DUF2911 domain-containing protein [bacterium]